MRLHKYDYSPQQGSTAKMDVPDSVAKMDVPDSVVLRLNLVGKFRISRPTGQNLI